MKCGLFVLGMLVASLGAFAETANAGGRYVYRGHAVMRGAAPVIYGQPVVYGPSSMYAHPTRPIYNPYQHPLLPVYGAWSLYPGYVAPYGDVPFGIYGAPVGYGYGW